MMFRISNILVGLLNCCTLLIGLVAISTSIFFRFSGDATECQRVLQDPLLILGLVIFVISLLGVVGSCFRLNSVIYLYLFFMFLVIIGLICFTVFTLLVTNRGVGYAVSGHGHKEYRLADFTHWLQRYVLNTNNWDKIRSCLVDARICQRLEDDIHQKTSFGYYIKNMSPIQVLDFCKLSKVKKTLSSYLLMCLLQYCYHLPLIRLAVSLILWAINVLLTAIDTVIKLFKMCIIVTTKKKINFL